MQRIFCRGPELFESINATFTPNSHGPRFHQHKARTLRHKPHQVCLMLTSFLDGIQRATSWGLSLRPGGYAEGPSKPELGTLVT